MKTFLLFALACLFTLSAAAQTPNFFNFRQNYALYNPAHAGADSLHVFSLSVQTRWEGTYKTALLSYEQPLYKINSGIGGYVMYDVAGDVFKLKNIYVAPCFNYNITPAKDMSVRIGVQPTFKHFSLHDAIVGAPWDTGVFNPFAPPQEIKIKSSSLSFGAGIWYTYKNLYAGVAIAGVGNIVLSKQGYDPDDESYSLINATAGYKLKLHDWVTTIPSVMYLKDPYGSIFMFSNDFYIKNIVIAGIGIAGTDYREVSVKGGVNIDKQFLLVFTYNFPSSQDNFFYWDKSHFTTYEAVVQYMF